MILLLLAWLYLAATAVPIGIALLATAGAGCRFSLWLALWAGLAAQAFVLQLAAAFVALYPAAMAVTTVMAMVAVVARWIDVHDQVRGALEKLTYLNIAIVAALSTAVAYVAAGPVLLYDSGLYQIQVLRWLAGHGLVPGVGLLDVRLGIPSAWLAVVAPFDAGPFQGRLAATVNGYVILLIAA